MIQANRLVVLMHACNAEKILPATYPDLLQEYVDEIIIVDDGSRDRTSA